MKRKHKTYSRPKRPFDKPRIQEEVELKKEFGLKNKTEIWKADAKIKEIREKAKKLISADESEKSAFFNRLKKMGFKVDSISDVLSLDKRDYLKRRLQTILVQKGIAHSMKSARQLITHKKVLIGENSINSPSYIVPVDMESRIKIKKMKIKTKEKENPIKENIENAENVEETEENPIELMEEITNG